MPALGQAYVVLLELQVGDDRGEVGVAGALAEPVERALHVARPAAHGRHRVGDGAARVVVAVDADRDVLADVGVDLAHDVFHLVRQRATVGVAQHDVAGALDHRRLERPERELGVLLEAVEEVLHVDQHHAAVAAQELDRVGDHRRAFLERGLQRLGDVVVGALGDDAHGRRVGVEQVLQGLTSSSTLPRGRRVEPNATNVDVVRSSSVSALRKNSMSLGLAPGQPPSMKSTPRWSSCSAICSLSSTVADTPSTCRPSRSVVSKISTLRFW